MHSRREFMGKSRRDVIFYDTDPKRANNAGKDLAQLWFPVREI